MEEGSRDGWIHSLDAEQSRGARKEENEIRS